MTSNNYAPTHHLTTGAGNSIHHASNNNTTTAGDLSDLGSSSNAHANIASRDQAYNTSAQTHANTLAQDDFISAAPLEGSTRETRVLNDEDEPRTAVSRGKRDSLAGTEHPFQNASKDDGSESDARLTSSVGQRNAPGRAGSIGEKAMSAVGYGGNTVERPKEEQGLGEKIVNFFGA